MIRSKLSLLCLFFVFLFQVQTASALGSVVHCFSCTNMDAEQLVGEIRDESWRHWLENIRFSTRTEFCADPFDSSFAMRNGVKRQPCEDGVCLKLWIRSSTDGSSAQVWRSCIPNAGTKLRSDCTRIASSQGEMAVCTCNDHLCNSAFLISPSSLILAFLIIILSFFYTPKN